MKSKLTLNARTLFFGLLGLSIIGVILIAASIYFGNAFVSAKATKIKEVHADIDLIDAKITENAKLEKRVTALSDVEIAAQKFLPKDKDQTTLLAEIYSIASGLNIKLNSVSFSASGKGPSATSQTDLLKDAKGVRVFPFNTGIDCVSYDNFVLFLQKVELNRRKAQITGLSIQPVETKNDNCPIGNIAVSNIRIEVYLKNE